MLWPLNWTINGRIQWVCPFNLIIICFFSVKYFLHQSQVIPSCTSVDKFILWLCSVHVYSWQILKLKRLQLLILLMPIFILVSVYHDVKPKEIFKLCLNQYTTNYIVCIWHENDCVLVLDNLPSGRLWAVKSWENARKYCFHAQCINFFNEFIWWIFIQLFIFHFYQQN